MSRLLDTNQMAARFDVNRRTIFRWLREGRLPIPVKNWGWLRWDEKQIAENAELSHESKKTATNSAK